MTDTNTYVRLINKHKGETCFVLGAGPSLYKNIYNLKFNEMQNHVVIAVNSSILATKWQNYSDNKYWVSCDAMTMRWTYFSQVICSKCIRVVRSSWYKYKDKIKDFLMFEPRKTPENVIDYNEKRLAYCGSSVAALDLAIQMNCEKIYLLGIDHYINENRSHFWQYWGRSKQPRGPLSPHKQQKSSFNFSIQAYKALKKFAKTKNIKIYNCSINSKLDVFKKIEFQDSFKKIKS